MLPLRSDAKRYFGKLMEKLIGTHIISRPRPEGLTVYTPQDMGETGGWIRKETQKEKRTSKKDMGCRFPPTTNPRTNKKTSASLCLYRGRPPPPPPKFWILPVYAQGVRKKGSREWQVALALVIFWLGGISI